MNHFKQKLILLHHWKGINWKNVFDILRQDPTLLHLNQFTVSELRQNYSLSKLPSTLDDFPLKNTLKLMKIYENEKIHCITIFDENYPGLLKEIYQPPWVLFAKGRVELLWNNDKLAVVGSRDASTYGKMAVESFFPELINHGWIIVSGLAKGIDAISHEKAIELGGQTIGVIAGGVFHIYPKENMKLAKNMMENHLIISEYPPDSKPQRWHFPLRNRIISGMTRGTLIIEAKKKSGSLITANFAVNEGREVFAIPGNIFSENSTGTNELIQHGAKLVKLPKDILDELYY